MCPSSPSAPDAPVQLRLFHPLELARADGSPLSSILAQPKRLALLAYLALEHRGGFCRRDLLLRVFWPEFDEQRGRAALRKALHFIRQSLGEGVLIGRGDEEVGLNPQKLWCDTWELQGAVEDGRLEEALDLYRGDLLPGFFVPDAAEFEQWLERERVRMRLVVSRAARELSERAQVAGELPGAIRWARKAIDVEPHSEPLLRRLIELLTRSGDRAGAMRVYDAWKRRLEADVGISPAAETQRLVDALLAADDQVAGSTEAIAAAPIQISDPAPPIASAPAGPAAPHGLEGVAGRPRSRRYSLALASILVVLSALAGMGVALNEPTTDRERVLVAPFTNETGDPALDPLGRMAADWLTHGLRQFGGLEIVPLDPAFPPSRDATANPDTRVGRLAKETGAGTIVMGSYYRADGRILFQAQVLDVAGRDVRLALDPVMAPADSVLSAIEVLQQRVTGSVSALLDENVFTERGVDHLGRPPSLEAYRAYVTGRDLFIARRYDEALPHFFRAAALDTSFVLPRIQAIAAEHNLGRYSSADTLAQTLQLRRDRLTPWDRMLLDFHLALLGESNAEPLRVAQAMDARFPGPLSAYLVALNSVRNNRPALAIEALERTRSMRGIMNGWTSYWGVYTRAHHMLGQHRRELRAARKARAEYPALIITLGYEVRALAALGRADEVFRRLDESLSLAAGTESTPMAVMRDAGLEFDAHGDTTSARVALERALDWHRNHPAPEGEETAWRTDLAWLLLLTGRDAEAEDVYRSLASRAPTNLTYAGALAVLAIRRGDRAAADRTARELGVLDRRFLFGAHRYWQAVIVAQLGQKDEAVALLRDAFAHGWNPDTGHRDPLLRPLRGHQSFEDLLRPEG